MNHRPTIAAVASLTVVSLFTQLTMQLAMAAEPSRTSEFPEVRSVVHQPLIPLTQPGQQSPVEYVQSPPQLSPPGEAATVQDPPPVPPADPFSSPPSEARRSQDDATGDMIDGIDVSIRPIASLNIAGAIRGPSVPEPDYAGQRLTGQARLQYVESPMVVSAERYPGAASGDFCYRPLYFEQANLERYGTRRRLQPLWSAVRFYGTLPALPYLMVAEPANDCQYSRYAYQAGRPAPRVSELPPLSVRGGVVEAGIAVGLISIIP